VTAALERLAAAGRPVLFTARAATEGGRAMPEDRRGALYDAALPLVHALDVEIASHALATRLAPRAHARGCRLVLSAHDFSRTPPVDELDALVERGRTLGADLVKLATTTETLADVQTLLAVTLVRRTTGLVTLGMGPSGPLTRVVLPAAGSLLTYGSVGRPTAPGQLSVAESQAAIGRVSRIHKSLERHHRTINIQYIDANVKEITASMYLTYCSTLM
jgi:3-dehydroquinate dehydratase-1